VETTCTSPDAFALELQRALAESLRVRRIAVEDASLADREALA
jgi:hypothetical protein